MLTSIKDLKRYSILCEEGMLVTDVNRKGVTELSVPEKFPCTFCTKDGSIAFFDENGKLYVTLWTSITHGILENADYKRKYFPIPFIDDGKIPCDEELYIKFKALFK